MLAAHLKLTEEKLVTKNGKLLTQELGYIFTLISKGRENSHSYNTFPRYANIGFSHNSLKS